VEGGKGGREWFWKAKGMVGKWKEEKKNSTSQCLVWFGLGSMVSVHPKTAKTASSTTDVLVGAGSQ
jgi:hypothetical protein